MQKSSSFHENIIWQMPNIFLVVKDLQSRYLASNQLAANLFGYQSLDEVTGISDYDMKCEAVEFAQQFVEEDKKVITTNQPLSVLYILKYADGNIHNIAAKKTPIKNSSGMITGVICQGGSLNTFASMHVIRNLLRLDQKYLNKSPLMGCYYSDAPYQPDIQLTKQQLNCLFYLLRGKTAKEISFIIHKSQRTIESHIEQLKNKFGCSTKSQLIDNAIAQGFLMYCPYFV